MREDSSFPPPRPLGGDLPVAGAAGAGGAAAAGAELPDSPEVLDLRRALALVLRQNPELAAFSWEVRAAEARELQAGLLPNPELGVDFENVGGNLRRFRESETTVSLAQNLLFEPKRSRAVRLSEAETKVVGWQYESKRLEVFTAAAQAFVDVLGAQERMKIAGETVRIAQEVSAAAARRVAVGDAPAVEQTRAEVELARVSIESERARQDLDACRIRLAAMWGCTVPRFSEAAGTLECDTELPSLEALREHLRRNPELLSAAAEVVKSRAALALERSKRIPDLTAQIGYRRIEGDDVDTFVFGFSVPLPLFDRNQGAIREAEANIACAEWQERDARVHALAALAEAHGELAAAVKECRAFRDKIVPGATEAFQKTQAGYAQGTFDYLELLTVQETLAKTRADHVNALVRVHHAIAAVERLIGMPLRSAVGTHGEGKEHK